MLRNAVRFPGKKRYEGVRFNVISVTRGWTGVKFPGKKHYVKLEWPLVGYLKFHILQLSSLSKFTYIIAMTAANQKKELALRECVKQVDQILRISFLAVVFD